MHNDAIKFGVIKHSRQTALSRRHGNLTHTEGEHRGCGVSGTMGKHRVEAGDTL